MIQFSLLDLYLLKQRLDEKHLAPATEKGKHLRCTVAGHDEPLPVDYIESTNPPHWALTVTADVVIHL